jgi:hypothetical protein
MRTPTRSRIAIVLTTSRMTSFSSQITTANSMTDLDEDNLDEAKIEALFAPTNWGKRRFPSSAEMRKSCHLGKADFIAFIEVEKLMIKREWSLRHIILLYTGFEDYLMLYSAIKRLATRFYDTQILVALLSFLHR